MALLYTTSSCKTFASLKYEQLSHTEIALLYPSSVFKTLASAKILFSICVCIFRKDVLCLVKNLLASLLSLCLRYVSLKIEYAL